MGTKRTKKCPHCKGTGRVKIDSAGYTKEELKKIKEDLKEFTF